MADEIRTQPTEGQKKDLADTIAKALFAANVDQGGDFYIEVGPDKYETTLQFLDGPSEPGLKSNELRVSCYGSNEDSPEVVENGDAYEEWEDVLVVSVRYEKRRKVS